jgi:hypothetical protein
MPERRGSTMSDKQIAHAVVNDIPVTFRIIGTGNPLVEVVGWVCGVDDFHWNVVDAQGFTKLIHKTTAIVEPHSDSLAPTEAAEAVVAPFRKHIEATIYGRATHAPEP